MQPFSEHGRFKLQSLSSHACENTHSSQGRKIQDVSVALVPERAAKTALARYSRSLSHSSFRDHVAADSRGGGGRSVQEICAAVSHGRTAGSVERADRPGGMERIGILPQGAGLACIGKGNRKERQVSRIGGGATGTAGRGTLYRGCCGQYSFWRRHRGGGRGRAHSTAAGLLGDGCELKDAASGS